MRFAILFVVIAAAGCEPNVPKTNQLCGKAAVNYAKCALGSNATVEQRSDMEVHENRWIRLCRAVFNNSDEGLRPAEKELYAGLVAEGSASAASEFDCAAKASTCEQVDACGQ